MSLQKNLNLGCGRDYRAGWDNWDISSDVKADVYLDIAAPSRWRAESHYYDQIYCSGVLEQIAEGKGLVHVMNECHRVIKKNGGFTIIVPSAKFSNAFKDPFDVRYFTESTFKYFMYNANEYKLYGSVYGFKPWKLESIHTNENGIITVVLQKYAA